MPRWQPSFVTTEMSVKLISITVINSFMSPNAICFKVLLMMAVKRTPWLRNNCNVLLARLAGTDLITGALGQPLFVTKQIHRLTGCLESHSVCVLQHVAAVCTNISVIASIEHLALPSIERYIAIKYPYRYLHMVTTPRLTSAVI